MAIEDRSGGRPVTSGPGGINEGTSANEALIRSRVKGDAFDRMQLTVGGSLVTGDGTTRPSTGQYGYAELGADGLLLPAQSGTIVFRPESYGAVGNGSTDDITALNACVAAAVAVNGKVVLAHNTVYAISTPLLVAGDCTIEGGGVYQDTAAASVTGATTTVAAPFIHGSIILQTGAAQDGIQITGTAPNVHFRGFGVKFADAIRFSNTGHGINAEATTVLGTGHEYSVCNGLWENITVFGHDGDHYAFRFINVMLSTFVNLRGHGGGGLLYENDTTTTIIAGNSVFVHPFFELYVDGTAHGYDLRAAGNGAGGGPLNLIDFYRPQVNVLDFSAVAGLGNPTAPTVAQYMWVQTLGAGDPQGITLVSPDFESGPVASPVDFGTVGNTVVTGNPLFLMGGGANPVYASYEPSYNARPTVTVHAAAGVGATALISDAVVAQTSTDLGGVLVVNTGGSATAADADFVTVVWAQLTGALSVQLTSFSSKYAGAAGADFYVSAITATGFTIRAANLPATGGQYQIAYSVVPAKP